MITRKLRQQLDASPKGNLAGPSKGASSSELTPSRKSLRLLKKEAPNYTDTKVVKDARKSPLKRVVKIKRENTFGTIPEVPVGTAYRKRIEASRAGIHKPPVAGIHGNSALGCYSIVLSGGYEDDVDHGESFIYTGEGGRNWGGTKANRKNKANAQSTNQVLTRGNLALSKNVKNKYPVRVLRGSNLKSKYAPVDGYRYDGLYKVVEYHLEAGKSGFLVYKFKFERLENQGPVPWSEDFKNENLYEESSFHGIKIKNELEVTETCPAWSAFPVAPARKSAPGILQLNPSFLHGAKRKSSGVSSAASTSPTGVGDPTTQGDPGNINTSTAVVTLAGQKSPLQLMRASTSSASVMAELQRQFFDLPPSFTGTHPAPGSEGGKSTVGDLVECRRDSESSVDLQETCPAWSAFPVAPPRKSSPGSLQLNSSFLHAKRKSQLKSSGVSSAASTSPTGVGDPTTQGNPGNIYTSTAVVTLAGQKSSSQLMRASTSSASVMAELQRQFFDHPPSFTGTPPQPAPGSEGEKSTVGDLAECRRDSESSVNLQDEKDPEKRISVLLDKIAAIRKKHMALRAEVRAINQKRREARKKASKASIQSNKFLGHSYHISHINLLTFDFELEGHF